MINFSLLQYSSVIKKYAFPIHLRNGLEFLIHQKYVAQSTFFVGKQQFAYDQFEQKDIVPIEPFQKLEFRVLPEKFVFFSTH